MTTTIQSFRRAGWLRVPIALTLALISAGPRSARHPGTLTPAAEVQTVTSRLQALPAHRHEGV